MHILTNHWTFETFAISQQCCCERFVFSYFLCVLAFFLSHTIWPQQKCWLSFCTFNSFEQCKICCMFGQMKTWKMEMNKYGSEFLCVRIPFFSCNIYFCCCFCFLFVSLCLFLDLTQQMHQTDVRGFIKCFAWLSIVEITVGIVST